MSLLNNAIMLSVIMLNGVTLSVIMLNDLMLDTVRLKFMLNIVTLNVFILLLCLVSLC
jgi:hypothetical protein